MTGKKRKKSGILAIENPDSTPIMSRFRSMYKMINDLIEKEKPEFVVMEATQFQNNYGVFSQLSRLQGLIMGLLFQKDIGFVFVEPTRWKSYCGITARGRVAQKAMTIEFVNDKYGIDASEDEADAIGIATWAANKLVEENTDGK